MTRPPAPPPEIDAAVGLLPEAVRAAERERLQRAFVAPHVAPLYDDVLPEADNKAHAHGMVVLMLQGAGYRWAGERWVRRLVEEGRRGGQSPRHVSPTARA